MSEEKSQTFYDGSVAQACDELSFWVLGGKRFPYLLATRTLFNQRNSDLLTQGRIWGFHHPVLRRRLMDAVSNETIHEPWISDNVTDIEDRESFYKRFLESLPRWEQQSQ